MKRLIFLILLLVPAVAVGQHSHAPATTPAPPATTDERTQITDKPLNDTQLSVTNLTAATGDIASLVAPEAGAANGRLTSWVSG